MRWAKSATFAITFITCMYSQFHKFVSYTPNTWSIRRLQNVAKNFLILKTNFINKHVQWIRRIFGNFNGTAILIFAKNLICMLFCMVNKNGYDELQHQIIHLCNVKPFKCNAHTRYVILIGYNIHTGISKWKVNKIDRILDFIF